MSLSASSSRQQSKKNSRLGGKKVSIALKRASTADMSGPRPPYWKDWPGNNYFLCGGRIMVGSDVSFLCVTIFFDDSSFCSLRCLRGSSFEYCSCGRRCRDICGGVLFSNESSPDRSRNNSTWKRAQA
eukprot:TRINITY_DN6580_c0_g1_i1.p1 TRINITY_DN6580_c0_g1~~TRINITY_DN6580_c0_g1_i1.p1  ORF type:complete len:128 (+),score=8.68 TRINITY_DN6580_c0_g1_i1:175-558(+)